jgi:hypothetical protein
LGILRQEKSGNPGWMRSNSAGRPVSLPINNNEKYAASNEMNIETGQKKIESKCF